MDKIGVLAQAAKAGFRGVFDRFLSHKSAAGFEHFVDKGFALAGRVRAPIVAPNPPPALSPEIQCFFSR